MFALRFKSKFFDPEDTGGDADRPLLDAGNVGIVDGPDDEPMVAAVVDDDDVEFGRLAVVVFSSEGNTS